MKKYILLAAALVCVGGDSVRAMVSEPKPWRPTHQQILLSALAAAAAGDVAVRGKKSVLGRGFSWVKNGSENGRWNDVKAAPGKIGRHMWRHKGRYAMLLAYLMYVLKHKKDYQRWWHGSVRGKGRSLFFPVSKPLHSAVRTVRGSGSRTRATGAFDQLPGNQKGS
ncbi:MAG: hypothetical protein PVJ92_02700 [Candidatus Dependentiae bacterium]